MALPTKSVKDLQKYLNGVVERSVHHAPGVSEIIYPLIGLIISRMDTGKDIELRGYGGTPANMLWVHINGTRYAFRYDHENDTIEIRKDTARGPVLHTINNSQKNRALIQIFDGL